MRTKHLLMALALPTVFAACTADDILEQGSNVNNMAARKAVGEISFVNSDIQSRLVFDNGLKWTAEDKLGAALMDELTGDPYNAQNPASNYTIGDKIYSNYQYDYDGTGFSNGNAVLVEGNYFVYAQFNKNQKRSGLAYSIEANQISGAGYDAWYKNQFFLDHIFVKQGDSQVGVNVLPAFPKVNMAIAYEGATSGIEVRKVMVKDATGKFALNGAVKPAAATVDYDALAGLGATGVTGKKFSAANYQVSGSKSLDYVFNAYKKALKDYEDGVFTLAEGKTIADIASPNVKTYFVADATKSENVTLNYTTPAASVKGVMVLPLSESHTASNLVIEIYTNKGLVTIAGGAVAMSNAFAFNQTIAGTDPVAYGKAYATTSSDDLKVKAAADIRFNDGIQKAFVTGMKADGLQKVEIGFKENAILVPNTLTVTNTEELEYYLANWYTGKKNQIVGGVNPEDKNIVTVIAAPGEGQKVEINNTVLSFINTEGNPSLKFEGKIEIAAGTVSEAINKIAKGANALNVINNADQTWTATQAFTNLTNKGTLIVGTGAQSETATYTVANAIVNEGTLTINKALAGGNKVYNAATLNVNANLGTLVNGAKEDVLDEEDIIATAVANLNGGKTVTTLANYATVNAANATVGALTNNATINVNGTLVVSGTSVNNSAIAIAESSLLKVTGTFENAEEGTITNNQSLNVSKGTLTNNGKIVNNGEASCNADGAKFINNAEIEGFSESITLVSENNAGAEILVADNTALVTIPGEIVDDKRAGRVTFVVDEQADLMVIPSCANSLRITASTIDLTVDVNPSTNNKESFETLLSDTKHLEFRSQQTMNIKYFGTGTIFTNVYFNADEATSQVRFNTYGDLTAKESLYVSKNAMVIVNNNLNYNGVASKLDNEGKLYVIGMLNFAQIAKPGNVAGLAFMGDVFCTGGDDANIDWADTDQAEVVAGSADDITTALSKAATETIVLVGEAELTSDLMINKNVTIKGGTISGKTVKVAESAKVKFEGVTFAKASNGGTASAILWDAKKVGTEITIEGCTFEGSYDWDAIQLGNLGSAKVVIKNNTFVAPEEVNGNGSYIHIAATTNADISSTATVTIEGNTFGSCDKFNDNPIKLYGLANYSQWIVGKNTMASAYKPVSGAQKNKIQVLVAKGDHTSDNYYDNYKTPSQTYDAFVANEVKPLVD